MLLLNFRADSCELAEINVTTALCSRPVPIVDFGEKCFGAASRIT